MAQLMYCGVKGIIRRKDGRILFLKHRTPSFPDGYLDLPGGRLNVGEDPYDALRREVFEETKLLVQVGEPVGMYHFIRKDGNQVTATMFDCVCDNTDSLVLDGNPDSTENLSQPQWLTPEEALERRGEMVDPSFEKFLRTVR